MQPLRYYLIIINILTFIIRGVDKRIARANGVRFAQAEETGQHKDTVETKGRISEKTLLLLSVLGGRAGGYLAMTLFRHKTIKGSFLWKFRVIVMVWVVMLGWLLIT